MQRQLRPLVVGLCVLGMVSLPTFAATQSDNASLQRQIRELKSELNSLKHEVRENHISSTKHPRAAHVITSANATAANAPELTPVPAVSGNTLIPGEASIRYLPIDLDVPGQAFVSSGPYLGIPIEYSGANLIINDPSINEDVSLIRMRKNINSRLAALGLSNQQYHSHLLLSGFVEGKTYYLKQSPNTSTSDIDLTAANLDAYILGPSPWTSALMEFAYDNAPGTAEGSLFYNTRSANSRVFINKAFIILGDFAQSPWYASIGQMYVPFGTYSSAMISTPVTKALARVQARAINIGYQGQGDNAAYGSAYFFKGDAHGSTTSRLNNGGLNIGYRLTQDKFAEDIGAGVIGNIADSQGMQMTGALSPQWGGFGANTACTSTTPGQTTCGNEKLTHRVPAYDVHGKFSIGQEWDILGEYITTSNRFSPNDLMMNAHAARPQALNAEVDYSFQALAHPTSIGVSYQATKDALALGLPSRRYSLAVNTSFWRNTVESIEYRHDLNYSPGQTATGSNVTTPITGARVDNAITAQIDLYF